MKKKLMLAAVAAVVSIGVFAGFNAYPTNSSASDILLANAEALAGPIVEIVYADGYLSGGEELCVMTPFQYFDKSTSVYN